MVEKATEKLQREYKSHMESTKSETRQVQPDAAGVKTLDKKDVKSDKKDKSVSDKSSTGVEQKLSLTDDGLTPLTQSTWASGMIIVAE